MWSSRLETYISFLSRPFFFPLSRSSTPLHVLMRKDLESFLCPDLAQEDCTCVFVCYHALTAAQTERRHVAATCVCVTQSYDTSLWINAGCVIMSVLNRGPANSGYESGCHHTTKTLQILTVRESFCKLMTAGL